MTQAQALGFRGYLEAPIWHRATVPVTTARHPIHVRASSRSDWIYGLKGDMAVIRKENIFDKKAGEHYNSTTKKINPDLWAQRWSVEVYSGSFDQKAQWAEAKGVDSGLILASEHEDDLVQFGYNWMRSKGLTSIDEHSANPDGPLWIFVEACGAEEIQYVIAAKSKWFMESKRPMFIVPIEEEEGGGGRNAQSVFDRSAFEVVMEVYQNPAATLAESVAKPTQVWKPAAPPADYKERSREWRVEIHLCRDDYEEMVLGMGGAVCRFKGTEAGAVLAAFELHASKFPGKQVSELMVYRRGASVDLIHGPSAAAGAQPESGTAQLQRYRAMVEAELKQYKERLAAADAVTAAIVSGSVKDATSVAQVRRASQILELWARAVRGIAAETDAKIQSKAMIMALRWIMTGAGISDLETSCEEVLGFLADPTAYEKRKEAMAEFLDKLRKAPKMQM